MLFKVLCLCLLLAIATADRSDLNPSKPVDCYALGCRECMCIKPCFECIQSKIHTDLLNANPDPIYSRPLPTKHDELNTFLDNFTDRAYELHAWHPSNDPAREEVERVLNDGCHSDCNQTTSAHAKKCSRVVTVAVQARFKYERCLGAAAHETAKLLCTAMYGRDISIARYTKGGILCPGQDTEALHEDVRRHDLAKLAMQSFYDDPIYQNHVTDHAEELKDASEKWAKCNGLRNPTAQLNQLSSLIDLSAEERHTASWGNMGCA